MVCVGFSVHHNEERNKPDCNYSGSNCKEDQFVVDFTGFADREKNNKYQQIYPFILYAKAQRADNSSPVPTMSPGQTWLECLHEEGTHTRWPFCFCPYAFTYRRTHIIRGESMG